MSGTVASAGGKDWSVRDAQRDGSTEKKRLTVAKSEAYGLPRLDRELILNTCTSTLNLYSLDLGSLSPAAGPC